ncbi:MAG: stage II sporulation protein M [Thermobacillus sp. ZCTH02-B1]|mgnify:CR=1 FL=1|uniref:stage II sporulation protein M n=1 Tax=Thermobacillus sp. ZCTH02-B1 TaxID=1858795 RepID=UPI000B57A108|nr:stage II sporulation protein M [Thermobacillus sp. ZCTH02-B1]OUM96842.1 MAG: stage II sporulation protein M [Thermobacillus sp. ZCTH02-B1]
MDAQIGFRPPTDRRTLLVFLAVLAAAGVAFGALASRTLTLDQRDNLASDLELYAMSAEAGQLPEAGDALRERLMHHAKWLLAVWLLGVTVVGAPVVLFVLFLKGMLIGFSLGVLVQTHGWKGMLFALAAMVPGNLLALPALLLAGASSVAFALHVFRYRLLQPSGSLREPLVVHTSFSLAMLVACAGGAFVEAWAAPKLIVWAAPLIAS